MKILYGISGHGNGHITRSVYVISLLKSFGHRVKIVTYGQGVSYLKKYDKDADYLDISGFDIYYRDGIVRNYKTFYEFVKMLPLNSAKQLFIFFRVVHNFKPDFVISDFEPFSQLLAKSIGIPLVDIDNNLIVSIIKEKPEESPYSEKFYTKATVNLFVRKAMYHFLLTFAPEHIEVPDDAKYKLIVVPPIIRGAIIEAKKRVSDDNYILIYQTSNSMVEMIDSLTDKFPDVNFIAYRLKMDSKKNLKVKEFSNDEFVEDLAKCSGIITNGGFTLISEAIYLKKPVFAVPIRGQYEQRVNGFLVEKSGYGLSSSTFDEKNFEKFLKNIPDYKTNLENYKQEGNVVFEKRLFNALKYVKKNLPKRYYDQIIASLIPIIQINLMKYFFSKVIPVYRHSVAAIRKHL